MLPERSHLPKPYLVTKYRTVSYLNTINRNFSIFLFLEYFQYFTYVHSRYTSQYTVPYDSLVLSVSQSTSCMHHVQTQGIRLPALVLKLKAC